MSSQILQDTISQIESLEPETQNYIDENIVELLQTYVIPEITFLADAANMPQKFITGLKVVPAGDGEAKVINTWGSREKPLALWFNNGTRDHGPVKANRLRWVDKKTGIIIYATWVRGVPQTRVMERGIEIGMKRLVEAILKYGKVEVQKRVAL